MKNIVFATIALLTACATEQKVYTPDGRLGFMITCSGSIQSWSGCINKAGEICGARGYDVVDKSEETAYAFGSPVVSRHLMVACKTPSQ